MSTIAVCDHGHDQTVCPDLVPASVARDMDDMRRLAYDWAVTRMPGDDAEVFASSCAGWVAHIGGMPDVSFESLAAQFDQRV